MKTEAEGNKLFPVFLKLENFHVLVAGGGKVALEKIEKVLANSPGTKITVVSPEILPQIISLAALHDNVEVIGRKFEADDLENKDFLIVAVGSKEVAGLIRNEAVKRKILANVADTPELCDFYLSSIVHKGDLKIAISTNGKSPIMARRLKEVLHDSIPEQTDESIQQLNELREYLKGDFTEKVDRLNEVTKVLVEKETRKKKRKGKDLQTIIIYIAAVFSLMIAGHVLFSNLPLNSWGTAITEFAYTIEPEILWYILGGFIAAFIDGALGMAYGVSATTYLMSFGIPPATASMSVHASEIFTSGVSGLMHLKFGNVNHKLFRNLLLPGVIGAIIGAYLLTSFEEYNSYIKPVVGIYTLFLGFVIIARAIKKDKVRSKIKRIIPLAFFGGLLDSIGGGGWGPIVSSTLIAGGRNPRYTIGSVNLTEFFVALASSLTFVSLIGMEGWQVIAGLIIGGCIAAPFAAMLAGKLSIKTMMIVVGIVVVIISLRIISMSVWELF